MRQWVQKRNTARREKRQRRKSLMAVGVRVKITGKRLEVFPTAIVPVAVFNRINVRAKEEGDDDRAAGRGRQRRRRRDIGASFAVALIGPFMR